VKFSSYFKGLVHQWSQGLQACHTLMLCNTYGCQY